MKHILLTASTLALALGATSAYAGDDCHDAVADWQPQETLRQMVEAKDWQVKRIKVDDGCYEVKGLDKAGNKIEAKFAPGTLRIRSFEVDFDDNSDLSAYPMLPVPVLSAKPEQPATTAPAATEPMQPTATPAKS
ncbi:MULTISPECIES: PepSY domain-containing protein [Oceanisphaera]|uniref:PepSY domain-containing protein n=1 Tax=Oceanisphaera ostreae TaxID=914151 RepID=A0ABW3KLB2_9GAMM